MPETCANCGRTIGKLETPHLHGEHVVCAECKGRLTAPLPGRKPAAIVAPHKAKRHGGCGVVAVAIGVVFVIAMTLLSLQSDSGSPPASQIAAPAAPNTQPAEPSKPSDRQVIAFARKHLLSQLKDKDAEIDFGEVAWFSGMDSEMCRLRGTLRAQNSFGAKLRQNWSLVYRYNATENSLTATSMIIGDEVLVRP